MEYPNQVHHHGDAVVSINRSAGEAEITSRAMDPEWDTERQLFRKVVKTFRTYKVFSTKKLRNALKYLDTLPERHQDLLADYKDHLRMLNVGIDVNQNLFMLMTYDETNLFENHADVYVSSELRVKQEETPTGFDYEKLNAVLKQVVRDWSVEGELERKSCYVPILEEIECQFGSIEAKGDIRVLVPGAGTGRLAHEIVRRGYWTEGNEFSMYMLFASNFVLNKCSGKSLYKCYPWVSQSTNVLHHDHQLRSATFPDIDPSDLPANVKFSMTAGDFLDVYSKEEHRNAWDCIVTCFFIDCATNIVAFLEIIYQCLKPNGVWINIGPLLYHYADLPDEDSIEPSYDFLVAIMKKIGFKLEKEILNVPTLFSENPHSMLSFTYRSIFFVCRKTDSIEQEIVSQVENLAMANLSKLSPQVSSSSPKEG